MVRWKSGFQRARNHIAIALVRVTHPRMIDQNPPDESARRSKELVPILPSGRALQA
jgi:hypothetical protein